MRLAMTGIMALLIGACSDDSAPLIDAAPIDAVTIDAAVVVIDAMPPDARESGVTAVCARLCERIGSCNGGPPPEQCQSGCAKDLTDCSPTELDTLDGCSTLSCPKGDSTPITQCVIAVACVDDAGGE